MTDIYLHIDARMADYTRTHPYMYFDQRLWAAAAEVTKSHAPVFGSLNISSGRSVMHHDDAAEREHGDRDAEDGKRRSVRCVRRWHMRYIRCVWN